MNTNYFVATYVLLGGVMQKGGCFACKFKGESNVGQFGGGIGVATAF